MSKIRFQDNPAYVSRKDIIAGKGAVSKTKSVAQETGGTAAGKMKELRAFWDKNASQEMSVKKTTGTTSKKLNLFQEKPDFKSELENVLRKNKILVEQGEPMRAMEREFGVGEGDTGRISDMSESGVLESEVGADCDVETGALADVERGIGDL